MSLVAERKYINLISNSLEKFKWIGQNANFRCNYCGDSDTDARKTRGYLLKRDKGFQYYCHKCHISRSFKNFLFDKFPSHYTDFMLEQLQDDDQTWKIKTEAPRKLSSYVSVEKKESVITPIAKSYLITRNIPETAWARLDSTDNLRKYALSICDRKDYVELYKYLPEDQRLIIPFYTRNKKLFAFQARALDNNAKNRYYTVKIDPDYPKLFGLDRVNPSNPTIIVEGPLDSLFLPNCIAMAGADLHNDASKLISPERSYVVYDNEPRNKNVVASMIKAANAGYFVHLWTGVPEQFKDINDMVLGGYTRVDIVKHIKASHLMR